MYSRFQGALFDYTFSDIHRFDLSYALDNETIAKLQTTASLSRFELGHLQKQTPVALTFNELYFEVYQGLRSASHPETVLQRSHNTNRKGRPFCNGLP